MCSESQEAVDLTDDPANRFLRTAAARADFLENGKPGAAGVPDVVAASWERSQSAGVSAHRAVPSYTEDIDASSRLVRSARPVLDQLGADIADMALVIALTDHRARLIQRIDVSSGMGRLLDRVEFAPGFTYAEDTVGTNGVGTAIESGQAISVVGAEHYSEHLQQFACTGAPVVDPITGRLEGILDVSTVAQSWSPLMHALVKSAANDIARNLLLDRSQAQQALFDTYLRTDARSSRRAVFGFGESVTMANAAAQKLFSPNEQLAIRDHITFMIGRRSHVSDTVVLSSGQHVNVHGTRIVAGGVAAGIVAIAECTEQELPPKRAGKPGFAEEILPNVATATEHTQSIVTDMRSRSRRTTSPDRSPAWKRAREQLADAIGRPQVSPVLLTGEEGTGRFTLAVELFHALHPQARSISIDPSDLAHGIDPEGGTLGDIEPTSFTLIVARNINELDTVGAANLARLLHDAALRTRAIAVVATTTELDLEQPEPFHNVLSQFDTAIGVPPLRLRTEDLPAIAIRLASELAPTRHVRLSRAAERTICTYAWPENIPQLRSALAHALKTRPVGEIQEVDLPRYCHTRDTERRLSPVEIAERDAIIEALRVHHGNRSAAAEHVGMSRSSIYRKIKFYELTT